MARGVRRVAPFGAGLLAMVFVAGCGDETAAPPDPDPRDPNGTGIALDVTDPDALLQSHARAFEEMDLPVYRALLATPGDHGLDDPGFRFYILGTDASDFPWLPNAWWAHSDELAIIAHMFDPAFQGANPPVQSIEFRYTVLDRGTAVDPAGIEVAMLTVDAVITVLVGPADGWRADTRLIFEMGKDTRGHLRIRSIREVGKLSPLRVEQSTWGQIKGLYW